jgi:hypothetical protein
LLKTKLFNILLLKFILFPNHPTFVPSQFFLLLVIVIRILILYSY